MQEETDPLLRQIKALARGLGAMLGASGGEPSHEVVFPQADARRLPYQAELAAAIAAGDLHGATRDLFARRYAVPEAQFIALGTWFFTRLNALDDDALANAEYRREDIAAGLAQLTRIQAGEA
ncbi:DUF6483 family protein [Lacticaseibacillus parakribbianus]|uniref:DUF6483 family protein n=1 Tax=Lacticaseibacillus parakribbianus TaxID=2970927 RepID=UPI0021CB4C66|nr:DUF6483 family protein [Lacticaseibacillus parakribbianus]